MMGLLINNKILYILVSFTIVAYNILSGAYRAVEVVYTEYIG
jgi:hypothetical protein